MSIHVFGNNGYNHNKLYLENVRKTVNKAAELSVGTGNNESAERALAKANDMVDSIELKHDRDMMSRDSVLDQYKYFVEPKANLGTDEDGSVSLLREA